MRRRFVLSSLPSSEQQFARIRGARAPLGVMAGECVAALAAMTARHPVERGDRWRRNELVSGDELPKNYQ